MEKKIKIIVDIKKGVISDISRVKKELDIAIEKYKEDITVDFLLSKKLSLDEKEVKEKIGNYNLIVFEEDVNSFGRINSAVQDIQEEYFVVISEKGVVYKNFIDSFLKYEKKHTGVSMYMNIVEVKNIEEEKVFLMNECVWANTFSDIIGYLDEGVLDVYNDFENHSAFFKTSDYLEVGGYKSSLKFFGYYELLKRLIGLEKQIYVIPQTMYGLEIAYEGDYYHKIKDLGLENFKLWYELARKESQFKYDRKKTIKKNKNSLK